jgi:putative transport protein
MNVVVENPNLDGLQVRQIPAIERSGVVISRRRAVNEQEAHIAKADTVLHRGDVLVAVGKQHALEQFRVIVGRETSEDLTKTPGPIMMKRVVVTQKDVVGKTLRELALNHRYGVTVTRLTRADLELCVNADLRLQFGDMLRLVGTNEDIVRASEALGNSVQELNHAKLVPMFVGIALGVLFGSWPITVGNIPAPLKLGLAGGPLIVAIVLSRIGRIGPLLWYMPANANILLREFGIVLFLSCVGIKAGGHFFEALLQGGGFLWLGVGTVVTLVPLLIVGFVMRGILKTNFMNVCGLLSGSMTDPPALAFANSISKSDAPSVAYATVYPLTMLLRILVAQLIVLFFCR